MEILIEATGKTPRIYEENGELCIWGVIIPENPTEIFARLHNIVTTKYKEQNKLSIHFSLGYFNTSSAKFLYNFFKQTKGMSNMSITWHYEDDDEDMLESGKELEEISGLKFEFCNKLLVVAK